MDKRRGRPSRATKRTQLRPDQGDGQAEAPEVAILWPDGQPIVRGQKVRCEREKPARGTWARYAGREGRIVGLNKVDGEILVSLSLGQVWCLPNELKRISRMAPEPSVRASKAMKGREGSI